MKNGHMNKGKCRYPSSHNHGSGKLPACKGNSSWRFHDYGRKRKSSLHGNIWVPENNHRFSGSWKGKKGKGEKGKGKIGKKDSETGLAMSQPPTSKKNASESLPSAP